jgi:hypothetical protein
MHDGDDTAYYLAKGCSVGAVEANPDLCARGRRRFTGEIHASRLLIEEVAIRTEEGEGAFYVTGRKSVQRLEPYYRRSTWPARPRDHGSDDHGARSFSAGTAFRST